MILSNEVAKKIEECCVKIDNLEKALKFAIWKIEIYCQELGCEYEELEEVNTKINRLKEGKEERNDYISNQKQN